jgi:hypothetical protein
LRDGLEPAPCGPYRRSYLTFNLVYYSANNPSM